MTSGLEVAVVFDLDGTLVDTMTSAPQAHVDMMGTRLGAATGSASSPLRRAEPRQASSRRPISLDTSRSWSEATK